MRRLIAVCLVTLVVPASFAAVPKEPQKDAWTRPADKESMLRAWLVSKFGRDGPAMFDIMVGNQRVNCKGGATAQKLETSRMK